MANFSEKDEWYTPKIIVKRIHDFYPYGFLDPASCQTANEVMGASKYYSVENGGGLAKKWDLSRVWLNPPYSQPLLNLFTDKLFLELDHGEVTEALVLINSKTDTQWFHRFAEVADARLDIKGRLRFWNPKKESDHPRYPNTLFYYGHRVPEFNDIFGSLGLVYGRTI